MKIGGLDEANERFAIAIAAMGAAKSRHVLGAGRHRRASSSRGAAD